MADLSVEKVAPPAERMREDERGGWVGGARGGVSGTHTRPCLPRPLTRPPTPPLNAAEGEEEEEEEAASEPQELKLDLGAMTGGGGGGEGQPKLIYSSSQGVVGDKKEGDGEAHDEL